MEKTALMPRAVIRVSLRPILSANVPHNVAPTIIPANAMAPATCNQQMSWSHPRWQQIHAHHFSKCITRYDQSIFTYCIKYIWIRKQESAVLQILVCYYSCPKSLTRTYLILRLAQLNMRSLALIYFWMSSHQQFFLKLPKRLYSRLTSTFKGTK